LHFRLFYDKILKSYHIKTIKGTLKMTHDKFKAKLQEANLTLKDFANIINTPYSTVAKYGKSNPVPSFVEPFLECYIENQKLDQLKNQIKEFANSL